VTETAPPCTPPTLPRASRPFAIIMGLALMLTGAGFLVLTLRVLRVFSKLEQTATKPAVAPGEVALTS
jgi:hypothetical protein